MKVMEVESPWKWKLHGSGSSMEVEFLWKWKFDGNGSLPKTVVDGPFGPPYFLFLVLFF